MTAATACVAVISLEIKPLQLSNDYETGLQLLQPWPVISGRSDTLALTRPKNGRAPCQIASNQNLQKECSEPGVCSNNALLRTNEFHPTKGKTIFSVIKGTLRGYLFNDRLQCTLNLKPFTFIYFSERSKHNLLCPIVNYTACVLICVQRGNSILP